MSDQPPRYEVRRASDGTDWWFIHDTNDGLMLLGAWDSPVMAANQCWLRNQS